MENSFFEMSSFALAYVHVRITYEKTKREIPSRILCGPKWKNKTLKTSTTIKKLKNVLVDSDLPVPRKNTSKHPNDLPMTRLVAILLQATKIYSSVNFYVHVKKKPTILMSKKSA